MGDCGIVEVSDIIYIYWKDRIKFIENFNFNVFNGTNLVLVLLKIKNNINYFEIIYLDINFKYLSK